MTRFADATIIFRLLRRAHRSVGTAALLVALCARGSDAQDPSPSGRTGGTIIDTVILERHDVFTPEVAEKSFIFRTMNALHVITRPWVIERELLLGVGDPYDPVSAQESERNLRARGLFSEVDVDTMRLDGRLALQVRTVDAWSTEPRLTFSVASDGTLTGVAGITEANLIGTGAQLRVWYRKDVDRDGIDMAAVLNRVAGTKLAVSGAFLGLSDQTIGRWRIGAPFYSLAEKRAAEYGGEVFDGRVLQFRTEDPAAPDTTFWRREAFVHRIVGSIAPVASSAGYVRLGLTAELRAEEYSLQGTDRSVVPDSLYGLVGGFVEYFDADFHEMRYFNGFAREDQDLSLLLSLTAKLAPSGWGYPSTGIGPRVLIRAGTAIGNGLVKGVIDANALFNSAGLDSGRVVARLTAGYKAGVRHAIIASVEGGVMDGPPPGGEFDLGFRTPPRLWEPHAFTGTRSVRATLEHRWYVWDRVLNLIGIGVAGFLDYGGAWYDGQEARYGGNVGVALLFGSSLSALAQNGQLNVRYRFGEGVLGSRFRLSFGSGLIF